ncbi:DNA fragmentation factor subunit beta isoform X3 [Camelus bactrianus]|uniref:DNAation factor subunit beta isoform X2 n=1 Tax=Camelus bactrianus TaxID=9837 RepID=A0A9W3HJV3_CAMBA|nr:DNA fragmentation factor subunit beta isoform X2 [Camelus bactrianus]
MSAVTQKPKTFKLRALHSQKKFGVAGKSCEEVLRKGCLRLQHPRRRGARASHHWPDLAGLCPSNSRGQKGGLWHWEMLLVPREGHRAPRTGTVLPPLPKGQRRSKSSGGVASPLCWDSAVFREGDTSDVSDISRFLSVFQKPHAGLIQAARQLLSDERAPLRQKLLADLLHTVSENIAAETRAEDPPWFEGLEARFRNKSGYLRYSCESRIRSYLREVTSCASLVGGEAQEEYQRIVGAMCRKLQEARYHGSYFDRGAKAGGRLCTPEGWFSCQGPFDVDDCASRHSINPYSNRESRVLFSTWNLDHIIEKRRTVVPTLAAAVRGAQGREVDWEYFYGLLFTSENLKLVHIACHKKTTHHRRCDPSRLYRARAAPRRKRPARKRP